MDRLPFSLTRLNDGDVSGAETVASFGPFPLGFLVSFVELSVQTFTQTPPTGGFLAYAFNAWATAVEPKNLVSGGAAQVQLGRPLFGRFPLASQQVKIPLRPAVANWATITGGEGGEPTDWVLTGFIRLPLFWRATDAERYLSFVHGLAGSVLANTVLIPSESNYHEQFSGWDRDTRGQ